MAGFPGREEEEAKIKTAASSPALHSFIGKVNTKSCADLISSAGQWLHDDAAGAK
jgi:hypothetical protein